MTSEFEQDALFVFASLPNQDVNTGNDLSPFLTPLEISRTNGGRQLDYAVFDYNLGLTGEHIQNLATPLDWARQVEVWAVINGSPTPIFWGDLTTQMIQINSTETVQVTAKIMPYHFGDVLEGPTVENKISDPPEEITLKEDVLFNPMIDNEIVFNRSSNQGDGGDRTDAYYYWLDAESVRTTTAQEFNGEPEEWDLREAVNAICWSVNSAEEFIKNPDINTDPIFEGAPKIRNLSLRRGKYMPDYLDAILKPLGYDWYVSVKAGESGGTQRKIVITKRSEGAEKTLKIAALGEPANFATTNTGELAVATDLGGSINKIVAHGAVQKREITVELYRGWTEANDSKTLSELSYSEDELTYPNAWRKWVANEAGDYNELRTTTAAIPDSPLDLSSVFDDYIPRRRKFMKPLTKSAEGDAQEVYIEYHDGTEWLPLPDEHVGEVKILEGEMGIYFAGASPPATIYDLGNDAQIRVTASVVGDKPLFYEKTNTESSPNSRENVLFLDLSDKFYDSKVESSGDNASELYTLIGTDSFEQDDQEDMEAFVDDILEEEIAATQSASVRLMGLNANYGLGDLLTQVEGRNISLNRSSPIGTPRYPQIVGVIYRPQATETELVLDTNTGL
jgi:hypothetical protein